LLRNICSSLLRLPRLEVPLQLLLLLHLLQLPEMLLLLLLLQKHLVVG
jgi:hypothetical protein